MENGNLTSPTLPHTTADDALRLAVGEPNGRRSATWRIWFGNADIYAAYRSISHCRKISIHYPRPPDKPATFRYAGYTSDYAKEHDLPSLVQDRAHATWPGLEFAPGYFIEFRIRIPECELRQFIAQDSKKTHWLKPPPPKHASEVSIMSGPASHSGLAPQRADDGDVELLGEFRLANGMYVWIIHHYIAFSADELQQMRLTARNAVNKLAAGKVGQILPGTRVSASLNCGDGTCAEVDLAADFLRGGSRKARK